MARHPCYQGAQTCDAHAQCRVSNNRTATQSWRAQPHIRRVSWTAGGASTAVSGWGEAMVPPGAASGAAMRRTPAQA